MFFDTFYSALFGLLKKQPGHLFSASMEAYWKAYCEALRRKA